MSISFSLEGKVALVTGGSRGIGLAIAKAYAEAGAKVAISARKQDALDVAAKDVGRGCVGIASHAGDASAQADLVAKVVERFGRLDILVCNAATNPVFGPAIMVDEGAFNKIVDVNLKGPFFLAKAAFQEMMKHGGGSVVMMSSVGGLRPEQMLGVYSVSKAALIGLTKVLAKEWGPAGVRVNAICPGVVETKFAAAITSSEDIMEHVLAGTPLGRVAQPEDVAGAALFLVSDAARHITGTTTVIDGGSLL